MFAIVDIAGFQEKVEKGTTLKVPLQKSDAGKKVTFGTVLLVADGENITVGTPSISGASIEAEIVSHGRSDKIRVQKFQRRKRYRRVKGHRQDYTEVKITKITA
jgi:large subunit ribosomal protein L21